MELQGYIDLMCGVNMWDWKAGHNIKSYMQSPQLALYTWGVAKQDPDKAQRAYVFLALDDPIFVDRYPIAKAVEWANDLCLQIEFAYEIAEDEGPEAAFPKNPGAACRLCGFKDICSEETKAENGIVIPESVVTQEEAAKLAETILNLENILKQAQEKLTDYCKTNGAFELNGEWFGIYPGSVRKEWDTQKLYELVAQFPLEDIIPILSINSRGIDKFLKKYPALKGDVEKLVTEKPGNPSFKHQKTPPKEPGKVA
ncbi:PD-(D/E)XK nuclease family protein [Syntrophomonas palmitatica]|uniref:PD-(D/E)XK nuclease family protein n=1 Tax=Syntrophomonas palmitatica TaxID=402877 RepID=UPI000A8E0BC3|nr:PD-(D/E)XK nuclease family protein [Syntrophomonas palmitatica]